MTQFDMVGYASTPAQEVIDVSQTASVNPALSTFLSMIVAEYSTVPLRLVPGVSSSDHASFDRAGYPACRGRGISLNHSFFVSLSPTTQILLLLFVIWYRVLVSVHGKF